MLKTCLDYDRGCQQCDPASPLTCAACKRGHVQDPATGKVGCTRLEWDNKAGRGSVANAVFSSHGQSASADPGCCTCHVLLIASAAVTL